MKATNAFAGIHLFPFFKFKEYVFNDTSKTALKSFGGEKGEMGLVWFSNKEGKKRTRKWGLCLRDRC